MVGSPGSKVEELVWVMGGLKMGSPGDSSRSCRCREVEPVTEVNGDVEVVRGGLEE